MKTYFVTTKRYIYLVSCETVYELERIMEAYKVSQYTFTLRRG